jgi:hypothetical protein
VVKAIAPAANVLNVVGIANGETVYTVKALLDSTAPSTQAFGDTASAGTSLVAAHRDHKHAMMATLSGGINTARTTVASAATTADIFATTIGNQVDWTGTTTCTAFVAAPQAGVTRTLVCAGAAPFTAGTNMLIDGYASGATMTCAAGDRVDVEAMTTTQFRVHRRRYDGQPVALPTTLLANTNLGQYTEGATTDLGSVTGAQTLLFSNGPLQKITASASTLTINPPTAAAGKSIVLELNPSTYTIAWGTFFWFGTAGSTTPPSVTASKKQRILIDSDGTTNFAQLVAVQG